MAREKPSTGRDNDRAATMMHSAPVGCNDSLDGRRIPTRTLKRTAHRRLNTLENTRTVRPEDGGLPATATDRQTPAAIIARRNLCTTERAGVRSRPVVEHPFDAIPVGHSALQQTRVPI